MGFLKTKQVGTALLQQVANLTLADRCDRCPAAAKVVVIIGSMDLLFCSHHASEHEPALVAKGAAIYREA